MERATALVHVRRPYRCKHRAASTLNVRVNRSRTSQLRCRSTCRQRWRRLVSGVTGRRRAGTVWTYCLRWPCRWDWGGPDVRQCCRCPRSPCRCARSLACCGSCPITPTQCRRRQDRLSSWRRASARRRRPGAGRARRTCTTTWRRGRRRGLVCS